VEQLPTGLDPGIQELMVKADRGREHENTTRASGSLNSFPPATRGVTVYQITYAGISQE
jgi:hypothetical protein